MRKAGYLISGGLGILLVIFMVANRQPVTVNLFPLPYDADMPLAFVAIGGFLAGILAAWLLGLRRRVKSYSRQRQAERTSKALEAEIQEMEQTQPSDDVAEKPQLPDPGREA